MKRRVVAAAAAVICVATAAAAQPLVQRIGDRRASYKQMAAAVKGINDQLRASNPSVMAIRRNSTVILRFAPQVLRWFPPGSGAQAGVRTRARPEIWTNPDRFTSAGARLVVAARDLDSAARRGDANAIRAAMSGLARACSNCHDDFRMPEE